VYVVCSQQHRNFSLVCFLPESFSFNSFIRLIRHHPVSAQANQCTSFASDLRPHPWRGGNTNRGHLERGGGSERSVSMSRRILFNVYCYYYGAGVQVCDRRPSVRRIIWPTFVSTHYYMLRLQNGVLSAASTRAIYTTIYATKIITSNN
jgi:hypothetical protein